MLKAIKKNGSPLPRFETDDDRTYFLTVFPIHPKAKGRAGKMVLEGAGPTPPVTPPVARLLKTLSESGEMGNADIREHLGLKDRAHLREHYIDPALAAGLIEMTIPDKPNSRFQKYRLTDKGRRMIDTEEDAKSKERG